MRVLGLVILLSCAACSVELPCSPEGCPHGCCDAAGICQLGTENEACGRAGACTACSKGVCDPEQRTCVVPLKPQVLFLVTRAGSTAQPANPSDPACPANCSPNCPAACVTRLGAIKTALNTFLATHDTSAWYALATYPTRASTDVCGPTASGDVLVPFNADPSDPSSAMSARASQVAALAQMMTAGGGSPVGASMDFVSTLPGLRVAKRQTWVVLLTGVPNCNPSNANDCTGSKCRCTISACTPSSFCATGCLDDDATVSAVTQVAIKGAKTVVIGVGSEVRTGFGPLTLDRMANAGGFKRVCSTSAECGPTNTCSAFQCSQSYYLANTASELALALQQFADQALH